MTCKHCGSEKHTSTFCWNAPKPPIRRKTVSKARSATSKAKPVKKPKPKKKRAKTRSQLVKDLDAIFSKYIRLDSSDMNGYGRCVTCDKELFWKDAQACHFYSRRYYPTRWNEDNIKFGCYRCNVLLKGNYIEYTKYMIDSYSREFIDELEALAKSGQKISTPEIREKIEHYKKEVKQLLTDKNL